MSEEDGKTGNTSSISNFVFIHQYKEIRLTHFSKAGVDDGVWKKALRITGTWVLVIFSFKSLEAFQTRSAMFSGSSLILKS